MILDIISLIIIVIFAIIGVKTGAAKVVCRLLSVVCSLLLAVFLSHFLAELVYNAFIKQTIIDNISKVMNDTALTTTADKATELLATFPAVFTNSLSYFGVTEAKVTSMFDDSAVSSIEELIMTPVVGVISIIFFVILFVLLLFLLKKVFGGISKIFRLPLIRVVDSVIGFVLGLVEGALAVYLLALVLKLIIPLIGGDLFILNEAYVSDSIFFSLFYFGGLSSLVQGFIYSFSNI